MKPGEDVCVYAIEANGHDKVKAMKKLYSSQESEMPVQHTAEVSGNVIRYDVTNEGNCFRFTVADSDTAIKLFGHFLKDWGNPVLWKGRKRVGTHLPDDFPNEVLITFF